MREELTSLTELETDAMKSVMSALYARYTNLEKAFDAMDVKKTGYITIKQVIVTCCHPPVSMQQYDKRVKLCVCCYTPLNFV